MQTLKGFLKETHGMRLSYKIKALYWQLRYAWQRAWRGYDDTDVFNYSTSFFQHCSICIKKLNKNRNTLLANLTDEETSKIMAKISELADHLADDKYYYNNEPIRGVEALRRAQEKREQEKHEFFMLFEKYIDDLWD